MARGSAVCASLVACLSVLSPVAGQQNPPQMPQFRTRVDLVVLDVSVLDHDRRPVRGLTAADFVVTEDGRPQPIQMFSAVDVPEPAAAPAAAWTRDVAPDVRDNVEDARAQILVLVLDDANPMSAGDMLHAQGLARNVVDRLGPRDLGAVVFVADKRSGQELTRDRSRLLAAIDRYNGPAPDKAGVPGALELLGPRYALSTLKGQAEALQEVPVGRKTLIYISTRGAALPDSVTGEEERDIPGAAAAAKPEGIDAEGLISENFGEFGEFVRAAQRANLNVYCIDPGGLRAPGTQYPMFGTPSGHTSFQVHNPNRTGVASLLAISANTGAFAIVGTNDPQPGLTQVFLEHRSYYLLAYASSNPRAPGRYRRIAVRVNRPGVTARTRAGYFEADAKEVKRLAAAETSGRAAMAAAVAKTDIAMRATALPFAIGAGSSAAVAVVVRVQQARSEADGQLAAIDVRVNAYDYLAKQRATEVVPVKAVARAGTSGGVAYEVLSRLDLKPGRYQIRIAAVERVPGSGRDVAPQPAASIRSGSVYCDLDVPDFAHAPLSLSGLVLTAPDGIRSVPKDKFAAFLPVVPTTERQFARVERVGGFVRVYQRSRTPIAVELRARVIDARNVTVFDKIDLIGPERFGNAPGVDYQVPLPLDRLTPGPYVLTIEARAGARAARRDVRFTVE